MFCADLGTEAFTVHAIYWLFFIIQLESVYWSIRTQSLYKTERLSLNGLSNARERQCGTHDKVTVPEPMRTNADIRTESVPILTVPASEILLPRQNLSSTLITKATGSSETSVPIHQFTQRHIAECSVLLFNIIPQVKHLFPNSPFHYT